MSSKTSTPRVPTIRAATAGLMGVAIGVMACSGAQGTGSTTQGGSDGYSGPIRLTNRSSASICGAEFYTREQRPFTIVDLSATPIAPGAEHTMEVGHPVRNMRLLECGTSNTLWDSYVPFNPGRGTRLEMTGGAITLTDAGAQVTRGPSLTLVVARREISEWLGRPGGPHAEHEDRILEAARSHARRAGIEGEVVHAIVLSADYQIRSNALGTPTSREFRTLVGMRLPDGRCVARELAMGQAYNGGEYSQAYQRVGEGGEIPVPCQAFSAQ